MEAQNSVAAALTMLEMPLKEILRLGTQTPADQFIVNEVQERFRANHAVRMFHTDSVLFDRCMTREICSVDKVL